MPFHSENLAQPVPALVSCALHDIHWGLSGFIRNGVILDSIFDAVEFSLRRTGSGGWSAAQAAVSRYGVRVREFPSTIFAAEFKIHFFYFVVRHINKRYQLAASYCTLLYSTSPVGHIRNLMALDCFWNSCAKRKELLRLAPRQRWLILPSSRILILNTFRLNVHACQWRSHPGGVGT